MIAVANRIPNAKRNGHRNDVLRLQGFLEDEWNKTTKRRQGREQDRSESPQSRLRNCFECRLVLCGVDWHSRS